VLSTVVLADLPSFSLSIGFSRKSRTCPNTVFSEPHAYKHTDKGTCKNHSPRAISSVQITHRTPFFLTKRSFGACMCCSSAQLVNAESSCTLSEIPYIHSQGMSRTLLSDGMLSPYSANEVARMRLHAQLERTRTQLHEQVHAWLGSVCAGWAVGGCIPRQAR
jgi:hypothetical protein